MYDLYFLRRFIEEMVLAQTAADEQERAVHLKACGYYGDLLHMNGDEAEDEAARFVHGDSERVPKTPI